MGIMNGMRVSGMTFRGGVTINSDPDVVAHWEHTINMESQLVSGVPRMISWADSKNNYTFRNSSSLALGFRVMADGVGLLSGDPNMTVGADRVSDFDFLANQTPHSIHLVIKKKSQGADNAECQFGALQSPSTEKGMLCYLRNGLARGRYQGSNFNANVVPDDQLVLISGMHFGGSGANNYQILCQGVATNFSQTGATTGANQLLLRITNGSLCDFYNAKIIVANHTGKSQAQIINWRNTTLLNTIKAEAAQYAGLT